MVSAVLNVIFCLGLVLASSAGSSLVSYNDIKPIIEAVTTQFSVANIVSLLSSVIGAVMGFVFLWWGLRKLYHMITAAAFHGSAAL